ncbi:MAG: biosynthetic peptidoglycan transglycosylase, partial [bacterium]
TIGGLRGTIAGTFLFEISRMRIELGRPRTWLRLPPMALAGVRVQAPSPLGPVAVAIRSARLDEDGRASAAGSLSIAHAEHRPWTLTGHASPREIQLRITGPALHGLAHGPVAATLGRLDVVVTPEGVHARAIDVTAHGQWRGADLEARFPAARWAAGWLEVTGGSILVAAPPGEADPGGPAAARAPPWPTAILGVRLRDVRVEPAGPVDLPAGQLDVDATPAAIAARLSPDLGGALELVVPLDLEWASVALAEVPVPPPGRLVPGWPAGLRGIASGHVAIPRLGDAAVQLDVRLALTMEHPALSASPVTTDARLSAWLQQTGAGLAIDDLRVQAGALAVAGSAALEGRLVRSHLRLRPIACQDAWRSLPAGLRGPLADARLSGTLAPRLALSVPLDSPFDLKLALTGDLGCQVDALKLPRSAWPPALDPAPRDDVAWLLGPFQRVVPEASRPLVVGPGSPEYWPIDRLPRFVVDAAIVSEDPAFGPGHALDLGLIRRALMFNLDRRRFVYGGSTIPQQLAKNLFLTRDKSIARKLQEALIALRMAAAVPSRRILELYLNCIEFAPDVYGIGPAARHYFGVSPAALTPRQAAFLAMAKPSPRYADALRRRGQTPDTDHFRTYMRRILERVAARGGVSRAALEASKPLRIEWDASRHRERDPENPRSDADLSIWTKKDREPRKKEVDLRGQIRSLHPRRATQRPPTEAEASGGGQGFQPVL